MTDGYETLIVDHSIVDRLDDEGIVVPTIKIGEILLKRMHRHGRTLDIDPFLLQEGLRDIESERPTTLLIDSLPKKSQGLDPDVSINWPTSRSETPSAIIRIKPNVNERDEDLGVIHKINEAFWLGAIATQAIAEGEDKEILSLKAKRSKSLPFWKSWPAGFVAYSAASWPADIVLHSADMTVGFGIASQLALYVYIAQKKSRIRKISDSEYLQDSLREKANELALKYPILKQDFSILKLRPEAE